MTPQDIRKLLIDRARTEADVARKLGVSRQMVSAVVHWHRTTVRIRRGIASELGIPYELMWGTRDPGDGKEPGNSQGTRRQVDTSTGVDDGSDA